MGWIIDIILFLFARKYYSPKAVGQRGEKHVSRLLQERLQQDDYKIINSITLPFESSTTQIDHVILSRFGVFVIETKNKSGWIFGSENSTHWTQTFKSQKFKFQNPLRQNHLHIKAVSKILNLSERYIHNLVVFVGSAEAKTTLPRNVLWSAEDLVSYIRQHRSACIDRRDIGSMYSTLKRVDMGNCEQVNQQHIRNVSDRREKRSSGPARCPRCGAKMLERRNKKTGDSFLGCSRFPVCRGTRKLD